MIIVNTYDSVKNGCQFYYMNMMYLYTVIGWSHWDWNKEVVVNLSRINKVPNDNH